GASQEGWKAEVENQIKALAGQGMRVLGVAYRTVPEDTTRVNETHFKDLVFAGLLGLKDPPRPEAKDAVSQAQAAGIRIIMKTGDHRDTALAIAREVGLIPSSEDGVLEESDLARMPAEEFEKAIRKVNVFARLTPGMKMRIAQTLQKQG